MDRCAVEFIARRWWRRLEIWVIATLLVIGGSILGFQAGQWALASSYVEQVAQVRGAYDEALKQRDMRLNKLAENTTKAAETVDRAADKATHAADTADKAAIKATEAVDRANQ